MIESGGLSEGNDNSSNTPSFIFKKEICKRTTHSIYRETEKGILIVKNKLHSLGFLVSN